MPEGPSIVILKEEVQEFTGKKVLSVEGNSAVDISRLENKKVTAFKSWGKHFLICFSGFTVRIHLLLFGTYRINERKETPVRLGLKFNTGEINFYTCSVKILEGDVDSHYDWSVDVMSDEWDARKAKAQLKEIPKKLICDTLLEQDLFSGVGNIIKNEVLYRVRIHPESLTGKIPSTKISEIVKEAELYSFDFLKWKKKGELKKHWLAHTKKECLRCNLPMIKKITGVKKRRSFFCENCQVLHE